MKAYNLAVYSICFDVDEKLKTDLAALEAALVKMRSQKVPHYIASNFSATARHLGYAGQLSVS